MKSLKISTPGKLFIAGEYAVVKGYHSILCATHSTLDVMIKEANDFYIDSTKWHKGYAFDIDTISKIQSIWSKALDTVYRYIVALDMPILPHHLEIHSQLDQNMYAKWGLGSSGALVVGLIEAVLAFHQIEYDALSVYKLAVISQYDQESHASFADIATASFKCAIVYKKFKSIPNDHSILTRLQSNWEDLRISPIEIEDLPIMVIHSGQEASSSLLVKHFLKHTDEKTYTNIFQHIDQLTIQLIERIKLKKPLNDIFREMMIQYEQLPKVVFDKIINLPIKKIFTLDEIRPYAKFSGAGGGDNIIVYVKDQTHYKAIRNQLKDEHKDISHLIKGVKRYE